MASLLAEHHEAVQWLAEDPERIARFEREAKTLGSLNHPDIAQIHSLEESDGGRALVMELVNGPTLAEGSEHGPYRKSRNAETHGGILMTGSNYKNAPLQWSVFVTKRPGLNRELPPGYESLAWVPNSSTLIYGEQDAVLVDTFLTAEASQALADWVVASGKNLTTIYSTHGHGDHFFGIGLLKQRFPHARAVARPDIVEAMRHELDPPYFNSFWNSRFPGQLPEQLAVPETLERNTIELEGHELVLVDTGYTDTALSTSLHVPSIDLVVAGDVAYNGVHPYMAEGNPQTWPKWIAALDKLESLKPRAVIAGHKRPENDDLPRIIEETRSYLRDFLRLNEETTTVRELFDRMMKLHGDRANPGSLWGGATAAKAHHSP
jgi:glyoxylase-like metal-dependent hydrolase (beta-lactamase superfamily II)